MKKIALFLIILAFPFIIFAGKLEIKDINLKVTVDDSFIIFTRDNLDGNNNLDKLGINKDYLKKSLEKNSIYLDIVEENANYEIIVVVPNIKLDMDNISSSTTAQLNSLKDEIVKKTNAKTASVYRNKYNYVFVDYYDEKTGYYIVNYYTVMNSKGYNFQLQKKIDCYKFRKESVKKNYR